MTYNFGEKKQEFSNKQKKNIDVWQSPKYIQSKEKAIDLLNKNAFLKEGDFWILMNETKSGKMAYTGLIISHNACLKLNDNQPKEKRFNVESLTTRISPYKNMLLYEYSNDEQGLYEVGEVSPDNCKNDYPHAMAFKRCFDRVVLKLTGIAYDGIYSDSEADEFKDPLKDEKELQKNDTRPLKKDEDYYVCENCSVSEFGDDKRTAKQKKAACVKKFGQALCTNCAKEKEAELKAKAEQAKVEEAAADEQLPWETEEYKEASGE